MPTTIQRQATIGIDYNTIIHAMGQSKSDSVAVVANFLDKWLQPSFIVVPVADGFAYGDKSWGDDGTGELRQGEECQYISDGGLVVVTREGEQM